MNKKRAFTMVELIFVIVILGILAAVAVPKLNASRNDAEMVKFNTDLAVLIKDFHTFYAANGTVRTADTAYSTAGALLDKITNVPLLWWYGTHYIGDMVIGGRKCLNFYVNANSEGEFLVIRIISGFYNDNEMCQQVLERESVKALLNGNAEAKANSARINLVDANKGSGGAIYVPLSANNVAFD